MSDTHSSNLLLGYLITVICVIGIYASCVSNYRGSDNQDGRVAISTIGKLEANISEFDRKLEQLTTTSSNLGDQLEQFETEFREYTKLVQRLRSIIAEYREQTKTETE